MSNRKKVVMPDGTVKKVYVPRSERRAARNERRAAAGAPPEHFVANDPEGSSLGIVQPYDPLTGENLGPPRVAGDVKGSTAFLIEGVKFVYDGLGGHRGFLEWAREHPTKFRELSMKLLPAQIEIQKNHLTGEITILHALSPPRYDPANLFEGEARKVQDDTDPVPQPDPHKVRP